MTFADPQDHVKQAERNNRTIKERVRATFWRLPFESLPKILIRKLVQQVTQKINYVCPKGGISKEYSPNNIMTHERLDYNRHFKIPLGSAVEAYNQGFPCNQLPERAITGIYVGPAKNFQEGHEIYDIKTKAIITRSKITQVPLTHAIIKAVEQHAHDDGMRGLKIRTSKGDLLWDSSWTAGVEHEEDADDRDHESDESDDDSDSESETSFEEEISPEELQHSDKLFVQQWSPLAIIPVRDHGQRTSIWQVHSPNRQFLAAANRSNGNLLHCHCTSG